VESTPRASSGSVMVARSGLGMDAHRSHQLDFCGHARSSAPHLRTPQLPHLGRQTEHLPGRLTGSKAGWYCQLNATLGLFSLESGEEGAFLESFFAKKHQKTTKKPSQWGKLIKGKL
jgi:hypothetical protein